VPRVALEPVDHLVYSKREFILKFVAAAAPTFNLTWKSTRTSTQAGGGLLCKDFNGNTVWFERTNG